MYGTFIEIKIVPMPSLKTALCMVTFSVGIALKFYWTVGTLFDQDGRLMQADRVPPVLYSRLVAIA